MPLGEVLLHFAMKCGILYYAIHSVYKMTQVNNTPALPAHVSESSVHGADLSHTNTVLY